MTMPDDRLPFDGYHPEIRAAIKTLASKFPARMVADAAVTFADNLDQYGPERAVKATS